MATRPAPSAAAAVAFQFHRGLLDDFPTMVWATCSDDGLAYVNAAWVAFAGRGLAEEIAAGWGGWVHPEDRPRFVETCRAAFAERRAFEIEYRFRRHDGTYRWVIDRGQPARDATGEFTGFIAFCCETTERREAEIERERFARILELTSDFVGMSDASGLITYVNPAGRKLIGWPEDAPLGERRIADVHPAWANEITFGEGLPAALRDGTWEGENALVTTSGVEIPVSQVIISHPGADGSLEFVSTIIRDISDRKREELARIEWANRYDAAIRASGQLLFDWNSFTNDITYAGDVLSLLGYSMAEMAGGLNRFRELIHPEDVAAFDEEISRVTKTREPFRLSYRAHRKDGAEIAVDSKGYFFLDREGRIGRMVGFLADVTAQRRAQDDLALAHDNLEMRVEERTAELARTYVVIEDRALQQGSVARLGQHALAGADLDLLFDEATALVRSTLKVDLCSVLELTPDGTEFTVRGAAGWPPDVIGRRIPTGLDSQSGYTLVVREPVIVERMNTETRFRISSAARESGAVSGISVMVQAGREPKGVICAFTLQRRNFTQDDAHFLESIANVLTAAIDRNRAEVSIRLAQAQAETASRAKSEFLSRMSHELRTPLNAILGFTQLLELDKPTPLQTESISHISRAGHHLLLLINEVLEISRIESGRFALLPEPIPLHGFLTGALDLLRPLAARFGVSLAIDELSECAASHVFSDRQRLRQVVLNLLSNAVKYNRPGGSVVVSCLASTEGRLRIAVRDTGRGIPPEMIERLFIPFERLGAEATDIEGTGIGLALSQRIASALGGEIGVHSVVGEGSTFWIELPSSVGAVAEPESIDEPATGAVPPPLGRSVLLYVEDEDLNLRLVERVLMTRPEFRLLSAMQGGLALDLAREHRPDLILLDLNLPDISGEEVLRRLKADPELRHVPVIMVSADAMGDRIDQLLELGATDYLTKPYRLTEFFRVIDAALAGKA